MEVALGVDAVVAAVADNVGVEGRDHVAVQHVLQLQQHDGGERVKEAGLVAGDMVECHGEKDQPEIDAVAKEMIHGEFRYLKLIFN